MTWDVLDDISPMSPYYKGDENDKPKGRCLYCYHDFDLETLIVVDGEKICSDCLDEIKKNEEE